MAAATYEYANEQVEYPEHPATVVDTVTINGVQVDIVEHRTVRQARRNEGEPEVTVNRYEALRSGEYALHPATVGFRVNDGSHHKAGDWSGSSPTRATRTGDRNPSLGYSKTAKGAVTAARKALELDAQYAEYGPAALAAVRTLTGEEYDRLDADAAIDPGDVVVGWGHGKWRQGVAVKVTPTKVFFLFTTPSGQGHLTNGSGKRGEVRLVRKTNPTPQPEPAATDEITTVGPMQINVPRLNAALAKLGRTERVDADHLPAGFVPMKVEVDAADRALLTAVVTHETTGAKAGYIVDSDDQARAERLVERGLLCRISAHEFGSTVDTNSVLSPALSAGDPLPWAPGYVRSWCGHSVPASEYRAGFILCEQCPPDGAPQYPPGTPEYEKYAEDLRVELGKFARGEEPYPYPEPVRRRAARPDPR